MISRYFYAIDIINILLLLLLIIIIIIIINIDTCECIYFLPVSKNSRYWGAVVYRVKNIHNFRFIGCTFLMTQIMIKKVIMIITAMRKQKQYFLHELEYSFACDISKIIKKSIFMFMIHIIFLNSIKAEVWVL